MSKLVHSAFSHYVFPQGQHYVTPPIDGRGPPIEQCTPFVVRCEGVENICNWIPLQVIVWAGSAEAAIERVKMAMQECVDGSRQYAAESNARGNRWESSPDRQCARIFERLEVGEMRWLVEPYDTTLITKCLPWAANGGLQ